MFEYDNSLALFLKDIKKYSVLSNEEIIDLVLKYRETKDIKYLHKITLSHLGFVVSKAMKFKNRKLPLSDLISTGTKGIEKAVEKYDVTRGIKFSTYSSYWVEMYMRREIIYNRSLVKITPRTWEMSLKISKLRKNGVSDKDIVQQLNIRKKTLNNSRPLKDDISLNHVFEDSDGSGNNADYCNLIPDGKPTPAELCCSNDFNTFMLESLDKLKDRERDILVHRFGLRGQKRMTLKQLSTSHNITAERVRQLIGISLTKMKGFLEGQPVTE